MLSPNNDMTILVTCSGSNVRRDIKNESKDEKCYLQQCEKI